MWVNARHLLHKYKQSSTIQIRESPAVCRVFALGGFGIFLQTLYLQINFPIRFFKTFLILQP